MRSRLGQSRKFYVIVIGLVLSSFATLGLGLLPERTTSEQWFRATGYYFVLGTFIWWVLGMLPTRDRRPTDRILARRDAGALLLAAILVLAAVAASPPRFRILADETNLAGTAEAMYREKATYLATQGLFYKERFHVEDRAWDKRPLFFPFLVSITHTLTGYRAENAFVVNAVAGAFCLWVFYLLMRGWFTVWLAGAGMVLLAAFPLFVLWVTSGGFEIVNLLFILLAYYWLDRFLERGSAASLERLGLTLVLLAQLRYESVLLVPCLTLVAVATMRRPDYAGLPVRLVLLPLLFLPVLWQRLAYIDEAEMATSTTVGGEVFSLGNLVDHLDNAWRFFATGSEFNGTVPPIFFLAVLGLALGGGRLLLRRDEQTRRNLGMTAALLLGTVGLLAVILSYEFGSLTHPLAIRLAIVFLPLLVFGTLCLLRGLALDRREYRAGVWAGAATLLLWYWPMATHNQALPRSALYLEYGITLDYLKRHYPARDIVIVTDWPSLYTPHRWGAVGFEYAAENAFRLRNALRRGRYREIIVIQRVRYIDDRPLSRQRVPQSLRLETLFEAERKTTEKVRISRVVLPADVPP